MYNKQTNEIRFPHIIPTGTLRGVKHSWKKNVNGGSTKLADLCIEQNTFFGANVVALGWIKEYGMYLCQHKDSNLEDPAIGFYIHDPSRLTELGRGLVVEAFPTKIVVFETYQAHEPTAQEIKDAQAMKQYYIEHGMAPTLVGHSNALELEALMKALDSGKAPKPIAIVENTPLTPMLDHDADHEHDGSTISPRFLEGRAQPKRNKQVKR